MTTPPQDPFGTPRDGDDERSDRPQWGQPADDGRQSGEPQSYGQPTYGQPTYDQPTYGQEPYGQQAHGQPPAPGYGGTQRWQGETKTESKAVIALVCAIAAWVVLPLLPAVAALMIGTSARREIGQSGGRLTGSGMVTAAKVIAWANIALSILVVLLFVLGIGLFAVGATALPVG